MQGLVDEAVEEFQRLIDHRGSDPFSPFYAVATLGLARAHAMAGDKAAAVKSYDLFLTNWAHADSDVPVLLEAKEEYRTYLTSGAHGSS